MCSCLAFGFAFRRPSKPQEGWAYIATTKDDVYWLRERLSLAAAKLDADRPDDVVIIDQAFRICRVLDTCPFLNVVRIHTPIVLKRSLKCERGQVWVRRASATLAVVYVVVALARVSAVPIW